MGGGFFDSSDLPPPPIPPPAVLKSPTHPSKAALEGRGVISPKAGESRDKRGGTGVCRPREGSDTRTSSSERKDAQERQKALGGKGNKHEGTTATKARQHAGRHKTRVIHHCCHFSLPQESQRPISLFSVPRRGHPALQPTPVPYRQQSQGPKFLQLHVLQGFRGPAERGGRPQEPGRHWPQHNGSLPARRRRAGGTKDLHAPKMPSRNSKRSFLNSEK